MREFIWIHKTSKILLKFVRDLEILVFLKENTKTSKIRKYLQFWQYFGNSFESIYIVWRASPWTPYSDRSNRLPVQLCCPRPGNLSKVWCHRPRTVLPMRYAMREDCFISLMGAKSQIIQMSWKNQFIDKEMGFLKKYQKIIITQRAGHRSARYRLPWG